jgi:AAA15 family ATPase/GTPase
VSNDDNVVIKDRRSTISIKNLNLDPNNYRFIDSNNYTPVSEEDLSLPEVQRRTNALILGKNGENVKDLIDSFKKNGYLPVDQIQVRKLLTGKYLVVEGNRRVACLNFLQSKYETVGYDIGKLDPAIFSSLPVVSYQDADEKHHKILMGLKHISGNKKWPTINQAQLIKDLHFQFNMTADEVCQSIGIGRQEFNSTLSTLALIDQYKISEYGDQFSSDKYSVFREIIKNRKIRIWINWSEILGKAENNDNLIRLFSWISEEADNNSPDEDTDSNILFEHKLEPAITTALQIRELGKIVDDEAALDILDETRNLSEASYASDVLTKDKAKKALSIIEQEITTLFNASNYINDQDREKVHELSKKLDRSVEIIQDLTSNKEDFCIFESPDSHFSKIRIEKFRRLENLSLENFSRINIFAGINNSGKTSVLEAISLLTSLNAPKNFINIINRRSKEPASEIKMRWFIEQLPEAILFGRFNNKDVSLSIIQEQINDIEDPTYYLKSSFFKVEIDNEKINTDIQYFEKSLPRSEGQPKILCHSIFSSPFSLEEKDTIEECHSRSLKTSSKQVVVKFIQQYIDPNVENIELDKHRRFIVIHKILDPNPDLSKFGEGMQRIFNIGLLFACAENGVLLIDEFENAIHASLLPKFVVLLDDMAMKFNVQVFLTTHSKECINAFLNNPEIDKTAISAYSLVNVGHNIEAAYFSGERLSELMDSFDFDIRGGKIE